MRKIKNWDEFMLTEGIFFKKDEYLRNELIKLNDTPQNRETLNNLVSELKNLNKLKVINKLIKLGYSKYLIDNKKFWREIDKLNSDEENNVGEILLEDEIQRQVVLSKRGKLSHYLEEKGGLLTFGILRAIFKDAKDAKILMDSKKAVYQSIPRGLPILLSPFYPTIAIIGLIFGTSRLFNRLTKPLFSNLDSESKYVDFLKTIINYYMKVPEGELDIKDRFSRAFVVEDRLIDAIKPEVIDQFTKKLIIKMEAEDDAKPVPDHYIENQLKIYLNDNFDVDPKINLKQ